MAALVQPGPGSAAGLECGSTRERLGWAMPVLGTSARWTAGGVRWEFPVVAFVGQLQTSPAARPVQLLVFPLPFSFSLPAHHGLGPACTAPEGVTDSPR